MAKPEKLNNPKLVYLNCGEWKSYLIMAAAGEITAGHDKVIPCQGFTLKMLTESVEFKKVNFLHQFFISACYCKWKNKEKI